MLALAPAHFIFSRQALDYICPLPFVLGWMWCVLLALETNSVIASAAAGLLLGFGFYSYIASWIMMPLLLALTCVVQRLSSSSTKNSIAVAAAFATPLFVALPWLWMHPETWRDMVNRYNIYDAHHLTPLQGAKDYFNYNNGQERLSVYWDYFNPAFLFFSGGSGLTTATRRAGVFLWPVGVFLACGIYDLIVRWPRAMAVMLLGGVLLAPLPATFVDERYAIQRELFLLPFVALVAACGAALLLRHRLRGVQALAVVLLLAVPGQYVAFYRDYFDGYRMRSASGRSVEL